MADVTLDITIPDALKDRVYAGVGVADKTELENWLKERIQQEVSNYEARLAEQDQLEIVKQAQADVDVRVQEAVEAVRTEVVL